MSDEKNSGADKIVGSTDGLDAQIQVAREKLARIITNFNGSENNKQIRMLRRRVLKNLLKQQAEIKAPNAELSGAPSGASA